MMAWFRALSCCALVFLLASWAHAEPSLIERLGQFSAAAHRGAGTGAGGNTLAGFEQARLAGVQIIEMDLRLTRDGIPVVYHDSEIKHSTQGCGGRIEERTLDEIRACRVAGNYAVPTFEEVVQWSAGRIVLNAEFKVPDVAEPAVAIVRQYDAYDWVYFQTKSNPITYTRARAADPKVALLFKPETRKALQWALDLHDDRLIVIELDKGMIDPDVIDRVHAAGKLASANSWRRSWFQEWGWNACDRLYAMGVNIAVTDQPCGCTEAAAAWNSGQGTRTVEHIENASVFTVSCLVFVALIYVLFHRRSRPSTSAARTWSDFATRLLWPFSVGYSN